MILIVLQKVRKPDMLLGNIPTRSNDTMTLAYPTHRLRRLRYNPAIRDLIVGTEVTTKDCILPLFIHHGQNIKNPIASLPGHYQFSVDQLAAEIDEIVALDIPGVILFGIPAHKDREASAAYQENNLIQQAIRHIKAQAPQLLVITDVCCCAYMDHGHCGILNQRNVVDNDPSLSILAHQALSHAQAGADIVAPSAMMDGMVRAIRETLDQHGFMHIPILSYAVKYHSAFYAPFREAAGSAPKTGDRKTYQMDPRDGKQAQLEAQLDLAEGADMLMIKPAMNYLDIIYQVKQTFPSVPLAAYQVSGEYAMIHAAAERGWIDLHSAMLESLIAIKRAGADFIISYFAKHVLLKKSNYSPHC
jgi:porphobilinogen synthase